MARTKLSWAEQELAKTRRDHRNGRRKWLKDGQLGVEAYAPLLPPFTMDGFTPMGNWFSKGEGEPRMVWENGKAVKLDEMLAAKAKDEETPEETSEDA